MKKVKIVAVVGSLRQESLNRQLALAAQELLGKRLILSCSNYADLPLFNEDIEFPTPAAVVREQVNSADGFGFTPEYNHFFPGVLKILLTGCPGPLVSRKERWFWLESLLTVSGIEQNVRTLFSPTPFSCLN